MNGETWSPLCSDDQEVLTSADIQVIADRAWTRNIEVLDYKLERYSNDKLGFLGLHCCLVITVKTKKDIESRNFFAKITPPKTDLMADIISQLGVFEKEELIYNEVFPLLQEGFRAEAWRPNCYFISSEAVILEDLRIKGFRMYNKILDKTETMSALSAIARMHAASLLAEKRLGKSLLEICPGAFDLDMYYNEDGARFKWLRAGVETTVTLAQHLGLDFSRVREAFEKMNRVNDPSPSKHNVIAHSDLWTNNLMFDDSSPPKCVLLDYQIVRYCPMAADFTMFLHLCTSRDFRRRYKLEMMKHYYDILYNTMKSHDSQITVPEWSELVLGVEEYTLSGAAYAILYFPSALMDGKTCAEIFKDTEAFKKFMYNDRKEAVLVLMKRNSYYNERIREALLEFVEMSQRLDQLPLPC